MKSQFDIIVVGGGHAGVEAARAAAILGNNTLLITTNRDRIAYMSCNPSVGGLAKGHMVRELDILGGLMGLAADETCIQFKRLNSSRGPAVRGTRVQSDKVAYSRFVTSQLSSQSNLTIHEGEVLTIHLTTQMTSQLSSHACSGVILEDGSVVTSRCVVITTGTFMNAVMHMGRDAKSGGRFGDKASIGLSDQLRRLGFEVQRLKTGTPARLKAGSIDWSLVEPQLGDKHNFPFSFRSSGAFKLKQVACHLTRTTEETHELIRKNLHLSPMYCGAIEGTGPRYCPSIEDKVVRFSDKSSHQSFLEPESLESDLIYLQGISTSLPQDVQDKFLRTIPGLANVDVARYGYAVEYDFILPTQIFHSLETRIVENLFLAGQINGTSGYEEAAVQGLIAGINASLKIRGSEPLILNRDQAYIGVLIDDLVTKGTREPYRMFTSRAEHRLVLREDNTIDRLHAISADVGLIDPVYFERMRDLQQRRLKLKQRLSSEKLYPNPSSQKKLVVLGSTVLNKPMSFEELLRRPEINCFSLRELGFEGDIDPLVIDSVEIDVKYSGYIAKQKELICQAKKFEDFILPSALEYSLIRGLSREEIDKLSFIRPRTLGQAQRISGVNPSAIQAIMIHLKALKDKEQYSEGFPAN